MKPLSSQLPSRQAQRGGFFLGLIVGLLLGLAAALAVALYVTKVPIPFINKVPQRNAEQDAAQTEKNRNWDPNAALSGKSAQRAAAAASTASAAAPAAAAAPPAAAASPVKAGKPSESPAAAKPDAAAAEPDPFTYFVQAGAFARSDDAEQQRAKLALMGLTAKVTEREQAGRVVYRVRLGPFGRKDEAEAAKESLNAAGVGGALVRVQR
jgi:cell division protein FtsN